MKNCKFEADCADRPSRMELAAKKTSGVRDAAVYFMAPKISAEFEKDADPDAVMQNALKACKKAGNGCEICLQNKEILYSECV